MRTIPKGKKGGDPSQNALYMVEVLTGQRPEEYDRQPETEEEAAERKAKDERRRRLHDSVPEPRAAKQSAG